MHFVKASPSEYLVVSRDGEVTNRGLAANALVWPGSSWVLVPSTTQQASFEMTQESADGISLRFKGIVLYHVHEPVRAARVFGFAGGIGFGMVSGFIAEICLGELRGAAASLTMQACVTQRKTTLTDAVEKALSLAVGDWGIALDVVQVAQVFVVDPELRKQLESGVRMKLEMDEMEARRRLLAEQIALKREAQELERLDLEMERARLDLRRRTLPLEQAPKIARALRGMFAGARISLMGGEAAKLAQLIAPLVDAALGVAYAGDPGHEPRGEEPRDGDQEDGVR